MNALTQYIFLNGLDHDRAMNALQDKAVISDNAVTSEDVADVDCQKAIDELPNSDL